MGTEGQASINMQGGRGSTLVTRRRKASPEIAPSGISNILHFIDTAPAAVMLSASFEDIYMHTQIYIFCSADMSQKGVDRRGGQRA